MTRRVNAEARRSWYTVVGVYLDNWQKFCDYMLAVDAQQAEELVRNKTKIDDELLIVAVFEGRLMAIDQGEIAVPPFAMY